MPIANIIAPAKKSTEIESIAMPSWKLLQKISLLINTIIDNKIEANPSEKPEKVIKRIGFREEVTMPRTPKSTRKEREAELLPPFRSALT